MVIENDKELVTAFAEVFGYTPTRNVLVAIRKLMEDRRNLLASVEALHLSAHQRGLAVSDICDLIKSADAKVYLNAKEKQLVVAMAQDFVTAEQALPPVEQQITSWLSDTKH